MGSDVIKSRIGIKGVLFGVCLVLLAYFSIWCIYTLLHNGRTEGTTLFLLCVMFSLFFMLSLLVLVYANFYAVIDKSRRELLHYSLRHPCGKVTDLRNCIGYFKQTRTMRMMADSQYYRTQIDVLYVVDSEHWVHFGLNRMFYHNFDRMIEALGLPELHFYLLDTNMALRSSLGLCYRIRNIRFEPFTTVRKKK